MALAIFFIVIGLALLTFGADRFVDGASAIASNLGIPPLLIGLTVVGFATSAPELLVAVTAALNGNPELAIGNAIGSNIANIGLVLGATAIIMPFAVHSRVLTQEFPIMLFAMFGALLLIWDGVLDRADGVLLSIGLLMVMALSTWLGMHAQHQDRLIAEIESHPIERKKTSTALLFTVLGLAALLYGSDRLVVGAVTIATHFGVSDLIIGLTIVAIGTSLPELAASIVSAYKGEPEIALGNVIGSNMFNILGVVAAPALIAPFAVGPEVLERDIPIMFGLSIALYLVAFTGRSRINRYVGALMLTAFFSYQFVLYLSATA